MIFVFEAVTVIACFACMLFSFRAANSCYMQNENNTNYLAGGFIALAYLITGHSYMPATLALTDQVTFHLLILCFILLVTRLAIEKLKQLQTMQLSSMIIK